ncbi:hypothetical protein LWI28_027400 [Acer negundo]|uniref:Helicase ATP-binding domain-containing protein n=1 Tax=Acer negundo TaxID=4023 RepID=A0AAD5P0G8_ACENE|nr:hypothetical protein LWI28_027400 [Acer negundo]
MTWLFLDVPGYYGYTSASTFEDLKLTPTLLKGIYTDLKVQRPSKIKAINLPMILTPPYKNLVAQAHNGFGKTTCFVLGMLSRNLEVLRKMGKHTGITSECDVPMDSTNYMSFVKRPLVTAQIVIGTPGTIKKGISAKKLVVNYVKILVFDEAYHMLAEDGFKDDSLRIMKDIQRFFYFLPHFNELVKNFVSRVINDHNQLFVQKEELSLESIKQYKVDCPYELSKVMVIKYRILDLGENLGQTIIFVRTRHNASTLHKSLVELGYEVTTIQGALKQEDRDKVNLVINYDLPVKHENHLEPDFEVYLHKIGRAGRFGRKGGILEQRGGL